MLISVLSHSLVVCLFCKLWSTSFFLQRFDSLAGHCCKCPLVLLHFVCVYLSCCVFLSVCFAMCLAMCFCFCFQHAPWCTLLSWPLQASALKLVLSISNCFFTCSLCRALVTAFSNVSSGSACNCSDNRLSLRPTTSLSLAISEHLICRAPRDNAALYESC